MCVGRLWLELAKAGISLHVARVESVVNIADGPTREDMSALAFLKAEFVPPQLPQWAADFLVRAVKEKLQRPAAFVLNAFDVGCEDVAV
jgi:hypothetical protein